MRFLIGISGYKGSGKTFTGNYIQRQLLNSLSDYNIYIYRMSLAGVFKDFLSNRLRLEKNIMKSKENDKFYIMTLNNSFINMSSAEQKYIIKDRTLEFLSHIVKSNYNDKLDKYYLDHNKHFDEFQSVIIKYYELVRKYKVKEDLAFNYLEFYTEEERDAIYEELHHLWRKSAQLFGTELGRAINENIWIDFVMGSLDRFEENWDAEYFILIVDDVRFVNEAKRFKSRSDIAAKIISIMTNLDEVKAQDNHASEREIPLVRKEEADIVVFNSYDNDYLRLLDEEVIDRLSSWFIRIIKE